MDASPPPDPITTSEDRDAELARLRAEVAALREQQEGRGRTGTGDRSGWWRPVVAGVLVFIVALLAPLSVLATWADGQIQDTDRYLETVAPLVDSPDVQEAIAARVETLVFGYLDLDAATDQLVDAIAEQGISDQAAVTLEAVAGPLAAGIRNFISGKILDLVQSDRFEQVWVEANRVAHERVVGALTGDGDGAVSVDEGTVSVDLASLIATLKQELIDAGFGIADRIPEVEAAFTIVQSDDLATVQKLLGLIDDLSTWLPVIALGLLVVAVLLARDRRRVLLAAGLAIAGAMLLLGATLNAIRPFYLDALPDSSSTAAAGVVYDQLVSFIRFALRGVLVIALVLAIVAWLSAASGPGATARSKLGTGLEAIRSGRTRAVDTGRFGAALHAYRSTLRVAVLLVAAIAYLALDHPTGGTALGFVLVTGAVLLVLEVLASPPATETPTVAGGSRPE